MRDVKISIAVGASRRSRVWKNEQLLWSELCERLSEPVRTSETLQEFLKLGKQEQGSIKDVGGYVGGYLDKGKRSPSAVVSRSLLTLDVDFAGSDFFDNYLLLYDNAAFLHATHKHSAAEPRLRLLLPLNRPCTADEYGAVARRVAGDLGIALFDNTTFEVNRLMYWPSHPRDVEYYCEKHDGPVLDVDEVLASYEDWTDSTAWPTADKVLREIGDRVKKQEDPHLKRGVVGAFCRTYTIQEAIAEYLSEQYVETLGGRYTYTGGSTSGGVVIYEDAFAYSHHGTDPAGGQLCNAFDLVRLHRFADLDAKKSFTAMEQLALEDKSVKLTLAQENVSKAEEAFEDFDSPSDFDWMTELETNSKGAYLSNASNLNLIFTHDENLKNVFKHNNFDGLRYITKSVPWRKVDKPELVRNVDYSGIRNYIECIYGIASQTKVDDSLAIEIERNSFHPVRDYLNGLEWDGTPRLEQVLQDYFGAPDTQYTRQVFRKWAAGAVSRIFRPGCKFDMVLVLVDPKQGSAKSSFFAALGGPWFSDTLTTVQGKEAFEQIQGAWVVEMAELAAMRKAEIESVKHFITKQRDQFRPAYGRTIETYERQCVFGASTNNPSFLRDPSGNRRFLPVDVVRDNVKKSVFDDLPGELSQIWAEAVEIVKAGEKLYFDKGTELEAQQQQLLHSEVDERTGIVARYLDMPLPPNWDELDTYQRRNYFEEGAGHPDAKPRQFVCVAEIYCECLGNDKESMTRYNTREINEMLRTLPGWAPESSTKVFGPYGTQRYYKRVNE